jgi:hypothetical protein
MAAVSDDFARGPRRNNRPERSQVGTSACTEGGGHAPEARKLSRRGPSERGTAVTGVRVLVGTRKGAFILTSDGTRRDWEVSGPHFAGWEIYHVAGSPADPDRLYASQSSGWFGQLIQRSSDGGQTWEPVGNDFSYDGEAGTHQWYDGTPRPWEFKRVWHLEPSRADPAADADERR